MSLIDRLPGVNIANADAFGGDDWSADVDIRGFSRERLGFVIDGMPMGASGYRTGSRPNRFVDNENLRSVTVLQGASAAGAFSTQALGGSIQYFTRDPARELGGKVNFTGGDDELRRYFVRLDSGPILGGDTYAYVSYSDLTNDHWMDYGARAKNTREHAELVLLHEFNERNSLQFKYIYNDRFANNYNRVTRDQWEERRWDDRIHGPWTGDPRIDANNAEGWMDPTEDNIFILKGSFSLPSDISMGITAYHHDTYGPGTWPWECVFQPERFDAPTPGPSICNRDANGVATQATMYLSIYAFDRDGLTLTFNKELGRHNLSAGAWYEVKDRTHSRTYNEVLDIKAGPAWGPAYFLEFDRQYDTKTLSAYIEDTMAFLDDRLTVTAGASAMRVDLQYYNKINYNGTNRYNSGNTFAPRAGAVFQLTDQIELFGSYTRNFKALEDVQLNNRDVTNVDTETADSFDLGMRYRNGWLNGSLSAYKIKFSNRIVDFPFSIPPEEQGSRAYAPGGIQINAGAQESSGVELGAQFRMPWNFEFYASAALNNMDSISARSIQTNDRGELISVDWIDTKRDDLSFFAELAYRGDNFRAAVNADYVDFREGNISGARGAPAYWLASANAGYKFHLRDSGPFSSIALDMTATNLFNESYLGGVAETGRFYIGAPRTFTFTVSTDF